MTGTIVEIVLFVLATAFTPPHNNGCKSEFLGFSQTNSIRGLAILMVILMHSSCNFGLRIFTPLGGIGVALFLILSGYGLTESYKRKGLHFFWKSKFNKIWIPYAIVLTVCTIWSSSFKPYVIVQYCLIDSPFWYISFLFYNYILFYVCHKYKFLYKYRFAIFHVFAFILFAFDTRIRAEQCLSFVTGMWISDYKNLVCKSLSNKKTVLCTIILLSCISASALFLKQMPTFRGQMEHVRLFQNIMELLIKYPFAIATIVILTTNIFDKVQRSLLIGNRFLGYCSKISLELYIIHFSLRDILNKEYQVFSILTFLGLSFVLSILLYRLKNHIILWIK